MPNATNKKYSTNGIVFFFSFLISLTKETRLRERSKKFTPNISQNITTSSNLLSTLVFKMFLKFRTIHTKTPKSEYLEHSIYLLYLLSMFCYLQVTPNFDSNIKRI